MDRSLAFYKELFDQEVVLDLGWNKVLTYGLTLQLHFNILADFPTDSITFHLLQRFRRTKFGRLTDMNSFRLYPKKYIKKEDTNLTTI